MGFLQKCFILCQTTQNMILVLLIFFILSSSIHMKLLAEGRVMLNKVEASERPMRVEKTIKMRYLIGSFPPRCDKKRCVSCGHCEAVQVPIFSSIQHKNLKGDEAHHQLQYYGTTPTIAYSRGDGISNYKPMCWKCKCGNYIFNP